LFHHDDDDDDDAIGQPADPILLFYKLKAESASSLSLMPSLNSLLNRTTYKQKQES